MATVPFPVFAPTVDAFFQIGDADYTAAFTRGFAVSPRLYGTPGKTYVVKDLVLDGKQFDGRGCIVQDAAGASFCFRLKGWVPAVRDVEFGAQGQVEKVTSNVGGFAQGAASIVVGDASRLQVGMQLLIQGNSNLWMQTQILSVNVATGVVGLKDNTTEAGSAGLKVVASFGLIHLDASQHARLDEIRLVNVGVGIVCAPLTGEATVPIFRNIDFIGARYCAFAKYGNTHDLTLENLTGFCGATDVFTYVGAGVAGSFDCIYAVDLIRDVTVTVNGVTRTYGTHWTFTSDYLITFLPGFYPPNGSTVQIAHYHSGLRGFVEDQRGATVSGGNQICNIKLLKCIVAMELQGVTLSDYAGIILDTNMITGLLVSNCGWNLNFTQFSSTWARQPVQVYNSAYLVLDNMRTETIPTAYACPFLELTRFCGHF